MKFNFQKFKVLAVIIITILVFIAVRLVLKRSKGSGDGTNECEPQDSQNNDNNGGTISEQNTEILLSQEIDPFIAKDYSFMIAVIKCFDAYCGFFYQLKYSLSKEVSSICLNFNSEPPEKSKECFEKIIKELEKDYPNEMKAKDAGLFMEIMARRIITETKADLKTSPEYGNFFIDTFSYIVEKDGVRDAIPAINISTPEDFIREMTDFKKNSNYCFKSNNEKDDIFKLPEYIIYIFPKEIVLNYKNEKTRKYFFNELNDKVALTSPINNNDKLQFNIISFAYINSLDPENKEYVFCKRVYGTWKTYINEKEVILRDQSAIHFPSFILVQIFGHKTRIR